MSNMDIDEGVENSAFSKNSKEDYGESENSLECSSSKKILAVRDKAVSLGALGKREICKSLFPESSLKAVQTDISSFCEKSKPLVSLPKFSLLQIAPTNQRFAFEGKVLNIYGTYDSDRNFKKFLRTDLTDEEGLGTVSLSFGPEIYKKHLAKIVVGSCIRVEGASVAPRAVNDGGSIDYTLHVNATTCISQVKSFDTTLFFIPEVSIRTFLKKASSSPNLKATIGFVIVQVDHVQKSEGGLFEQLTIADGPLAVDRATLTFVTKRKPLYYQLVDAFHKGNIIPYLGRNVGIWKEKSNTLSVLDLTLIVPLSGERRKSHLIEVFHLQAAEQGYGKEIYGVFSITNFNGTLIVKKCRICRSQNLNVLAEGAFCVSCSRTVEVDEVVKLLGEIKHEGKTSEVIVSGEACDKVLGFEKPLLELYKASAILTRVQLSEVDIEGYFILDPQGQVLGFRKKNM